ncbi:hypothetical protein V1521DRAFT_423152, partial [Lipomyces starkeyi]
MDVNSKTRDVATRYICKLCYMARYYIIHASSVSFSSTIVSVSISIVPNFFIAIAYFSLYFISRICTFASLVFSRAAASLIVSSLVSLFIS